MKKNRRVILVLNDIYKRGTLRDYLLFLAQKERKHIQQAEINKLNKSDVISSVCNHEWKPYYDKGYRKCTNCGMELGMPLQTDL
jgi:hypothetical protein